jgi:hypothetical protein
MAWSVDDSKSTLSAAYPAERGQEVFPKRYCATLTSIDN